MKKVITAQDIADARKSGASSIPVAPGTLVTPQAMDDARTYGIALQFGGTPGGAQPAVPMPAPSFAAYRTSGPGALAPVLPGQVPGQVPGHIPAQAPGSMPGPVPGPAAFQPAGPAAFTPAAQAAARPLAQPAAPANGPVPALPKGGPAQSPAGIYCSREAQAIQRLVSAISNFGQPAQETGASTHAMENIPTMSQQGSMTVSPSSACSGDLRSAVRAAVASQLGGGVDMSVLDKVITDVMGASGFSAPAGPQPCGNAPVSTGVTYGTESGGAVLARIPDEFRAEQGAARDAVLLADAVSSDDGGPGVGFMQFADTSFEWTFPSDEVLVVQEGVLTLTAGNGTTLTAQAGDALRVPAGTPFTLTASGKVRCVYSAWPK